MTRRSDKSFSMLSPQVEDHAGAAVVKDTGATVDLSRRAGLSIGIEIGSESAMVYSTTVQRPGGLPVGIEGRVVALLSGGLDSLVAAWMMMKRGCAVIPLHVAIHPAESQTVLEQIAELQRFSYGWELRPILWTITPLWSHCCSDCRERERRWTCLVCKHAMISRPHPSAEHDAPRHRHGDCSARWRARHCATWRLFQQASDCPSIGADWDGQARSALATRVGLNEPAGRQHHAPMYQIVRSHGLQ